MPYLIVFVKNVKNTPIGVVVPPYRSFGSLPCRNLQLPLREQCELALSSTLSPPGKIVDPRWVATLVKAHFPNRQVVYCSDPKLLSPIRCFWNVYNSLYEFAPLVECPHPEGDKKRTKNGLRCDLCGLLIIS